MNSISVFWLGLEVLRVYISISRDSWNPIFGLWSLEIKLDLGYLASRSAGGGSQSCWLAGDLDPLAQGECGGGDRVVSEEGLHHHHLPRHW